MMSASSRRRLTAPLFCASLLLSLTVCERAVPTGPVDTGPMSLRIVSGEGQRAVFGTELPQPVVVQALNAKGKAIKGQLVNFVVVEGGGSVYAGSSITNHDGIAQEYWTLGPALGRNRLEVRAVDPTTGQKQNFATLTATATPVPVARVSLVETQATMEVGATAQLVAVLFDAAGNELTDREVVWRSANVTVATVNGGLVTGIAVGGPVAITATSEGKSATAQVRVTVPRVSHVVITPEYAVIAVGASTQLSATFYSQAGDQLFGREVSFYANDHTVGSVTASGLVTGHTDGYVEVFATSEGAVSSPAYIVVQAPVASMSITPASAQVLQGTDVDLFADLRGAGDIPLNNRTVTWTSSDPSIASIGFASGQEVRIHTHAGGTVSITGAIEGITATAVISVDGLILDQYEPNDHASAAYFLGTLASGDVELVVNPTMHTNLDSDWFRLSAVESQDACFGGPPGSVQHYRLTVRLSEIPLGGSDFDLEVRLGSETGPVMHSELPGNRDEEIGFTVSGTCGTADAFVFYVRAYNFFSFPSSRPYRLGMSFQ